MDFQITLIDVCLPDYFRGYHKATISVPIYEKMTIKDLINDIKQDINCTFDYLTNSDNGYTEMQIDKAILNMIDTNRDNREKIAFPSIEADIQDYIKNNPDDEYLENMETCFAYFIIEEAE